MGTGRTWLKLIAVLALLSTLGVGCSMDGREDETGDMEIVMVQRGSLATSTTATGVLLPNLEVDLSFEIAGRVSEVQVEEGEQVEVGQVLAELDTADMALQVRSAEAALAAAQAQLDQIALGPRLEEIAVAQANLEAAEAVVSSAAAERRRLEAGSMGAQIAAAQAQLASAQAQQRIALDSHDQTLTCYTLTQPDGSEQEVCPGLGTLEEQARYSLNAADAAVASAQSQLDSLRASTPFQLGAARANETRALAQRDAVQAQLDLLMAGATQAQIAAAQAAVTQAEVALDSARLAMDRAVLRATCAGVVARSGVQPGEFVSPQMPVFTLVDTSQFRIEADVDEADIGEINPGQTAQVTLDAFLGHVLSGQVVAVAPSATMDMGVVSYRVTIAIDPVSLPLRGGMTANTEIVRDQRADVLLVPNNAIAVDPESGELFVEAMVDGAVVTVPIQQGLSNDEVSEVLAGLEEGSQLVVRSSSIRERFRQVVTMPMMGQ